MNNCKNCYHFDVCKNYLAELGYSLGVDYKATRCPFYKNKSLIFEKETDDERKTERIARHYD